MGLTLEEQTLDGDLKAFVMDAFSQHALEATGHNENGDPTGIVAREGDTIAGAGVVTPCWGALHIKYLVVASPYRGRGLAVQLMEHAFDYGRSLDCSFAYVETMTFQAPDFYKKIGFTEEFRREGYAKGNAFHYLRKEL